MDLNNTLDSVLHYFRGSAVDSVNVVALVEMSVTLIIIFLIRCFVWFRIEGIPISLKPRKKDKHIRGYVIGHVLIEFVISYPLSYFLISFWGNDDTHFIWNLLIAPGVAAVAAILIDWQIIRRFEAKSKENVTAASEKETDNKVNIIVNTSNNTAENDSGNGLNNIHPQFNHLSPDIISNESFEEIIVNEINNMKDIQREHDSNIEKLTRTCLDISDTVNRLQSAEVKHYGVILKKKMYECLSKGYATPQQYEEIESEYEIYHDVLQGNGQVEKLREKFLELDVHDPDTISTKKVRYGQYD